MGQKACTFRGEVTRAVRLPYLLFLPKGYAKSRRRKWPLIMFLHGMGERGDDLNLIKKHGLPKILEEKEDFEFIVVSPQCPLDSVWDLEAAALNALLDDIAAGYAIDASRIYLTGLSMGGFGTWRLAIAHPERFAAIAPICGGLQSHVGLEDKIAVLKGVPVWAFHGAMDRVVPLAESAVLVHALKSFGGDVRFTIYPDAEHDSWTETYNNPELYAWFLSHKR